MNWLGVAAVIGAVIVMVGVLVTTAALSVRVDGEAVAAPPIARSAPPTTTTTTSAASTSAAPTTMTPAKPATIAPSARPAQPAVAANCANPAFSSAKAGEGWSNGAYYVQNNMWNMSGYSVSQQLAACTARNWSVTTNADNNSGDGAVKTYPNVNKDYHDWNTGKEPPLSQFSRLASTFAATAPRTGIYNVAYDIWLNGVPGNREVMIWTENHRQTPSGKRVAGGLPFSGSTWDLYATDSNEYLAFIPSRPLTSGTLDLKGFLNYLVDNGRVPANSTLGQICFGVEIVSTEGNPATFRVTDFSVID